MFVAAGAAAAAGCAPFVIPRPYRLAFADDFDAPDVLRINEHAAGGGPGRPAWRSRYRHPRKDVINREKQIYFDREFAGTGAQPLGIDPFSIADGVLSIRAERVDPLRVSPFVWDYRYSSGVISSELTHWQRYGYFEARMRLPRGKGFWPAFWLLPKSGEWPPEIDVLEGSGVRPHAVHHAVTVEKPPSAANHGAWVDVGVDVTRGFHVYSLDWTERMLTFAVDGRTTLALANDRLHGEMYLIANLALGSHDPNWIPDPDETTPLPAALEIDYIRAFQRA